MAASMRVLNVKNKCASISLRCFLSRDRKIIRSSFSDHSRPSDNSPQHEKEEEEDFFGIPDNFKLQQTRFGLATSTGEQRSQENTEHLNSGSELCREGFSSLSAANTRSSERERRIAPQRSFFTTFGSISFDRTVMDTLPNSSTDDLALKAQEILAKLNIDSNNTNKVSSPNDKTEKQRSKYSKESLKHNKINYQAQKQGEQDAMKASRHRTGTNYFDEVYFPEQSIEEDASTYKQSSTRRSMQHIADSTHGATSNRRSEAYNLISHSPLSEGNNDLKSDTSRHTSPYKEHHERSPHLLNVVDEQYFGAVQTPSRGTVEYAQPHDSDDPPLMQDNLSKQSVEVRKRTRSDVENQDMVKAAVDLNDIDLQYFGSTSQNLNVHESNLHQDIEAADKRINPSFQNIVEDYISPFNLKQNRESLQTNEKGHIKNGVGHKKLATERTLKFEMSNKQEVKDHKLRLNVIDAESSFAADRNKGKRTITDQQKLTEATHQVAPATDNNVITNEEFLKRRGKKYTKTETEDDKPKTAFDVAMEIRQKLQQGAKAKDISQDTEESSSPDTQEKMLSDSNIKLDSKGFRVLENQVQDLDKMTSADIVRMLKSRIIFDHEDFLAIDKPYGLPCYSQARDRVSVTELLPAFAEHLPQSYNTRELQLVQGLDRDVTGAIILAKKPEVAQIIRGMYKDSDLVTQRFWAITKGIPQPPEGIIDIPIGEAKVGNIYKMVLRPRFMKDEKFVGHTSKAQSEKAITEYKVLNSYAQSALVECILLTNVKHQIRLHLASGLATPILGDHKYSNFAKMAPQKLHREMLDLLKIRQASVRHLVMHLHCRSIILKDYKGRMIFLTTHPPSHFRDNMRNLRIPKVK